MPGPAEHVAGTRHWERTIGLRRRITPSVLSHGLHGRFFKVSRGQADMSFPVHSSPPPTTTKDSAMPHKTASTPFAVHCPYPFAAVLRAAHLLTAVLFAALLLAARPAQADPIATTSENGNLVEFTQLVLDPEAKTWTGVTSDGQTKTYSSETASFETVAGILKCSYGSLTFYADRQERMKDHVSLDWRDDGWYLTGGDETTPAGVVLFKDATKKPVKVDSMVYTPEFKILRFEMSDPVEDTFFGHPDKCVMQTKAGIFLPSEDGMYLYWPADDAKRAHSTPIIIKRVGATFVLEQGMLPD